MHYLCRDHRNVYPITSVSKCRSEVGLVVSNRNKVFSNRSQMNSIKRNLVERYTIKRHRESTLRRKTWVIKMLI